MLRRSQRIAAGHLPYSSPVTRLLYKSQIIHCRTIQVYCRSNKHVGPLLRRLRPCSQGRRKSDVASDSSIAPQGRVDSTPDHAADLKAALADLQAHSRSYVNVPKLHLALRNVEQPVGKETIRIAVIGLIDQERTSSRVRKLVRLLLADPLKEEEEWERTLMAGQNAGRAVLLKVGEEVTESVTPEVRDRVLQEILISSPILNGHRIEILVLEMDLSSGAAPGADLSEAILVPTVEIPTSGTGRYAPISHPVHKALVLGDGIMGAASLTRQPMEIDGQIVTSAVHLPRYKNGEEKSLPFHVIDISLAEAGLESFRQSLNNAMSYEHQWFDSGVPELLEWLKAGAVNTQSGSRKDSVLLFINSILDDAERRIQFEESRRQSALLASYVAQPTLQTLREELKKWALRAHTELRDQLNVAFEGQRWRKLGWWKLFWRVDDVYMITSDMLNQRFLSEAEKEIIFLAGRIQEAGVLNTSPNIQPTNWAYKEAPETQSSATLISPPPPLRVQDILQIPEDKAGISFKLQPWPLQIPTTKAYLSMETVPALQALAQKLVLQTLSTSAFSSAFAALIYVSTVSTSLYEAGAVAAFGIVWSLRRMQKKWESARKFWEGEVREEGRKAIRAVEGVVGDVLAEPKISTIEGAEEFERGREAIARARKALEGATSNVYDSNQDGGKVM